MHYYESLNRRDRYQIGDFVYFYDKIHVWQCTDYNLSVKGMEKISNIPLSYAFFYANGYAIENGNVIIDADFEIQLTLVDADERKRLILSPQPGIFIEFVHEFQHYLRMREEYEQANNLQVVKTLNP